MFLLFSLGWFSGSHWLSQLSWLFKCLVLIDIIFSDQTPGIIVIGNHEAGFPETNLQFGGVLLKCPSKFQAAGEEGFPEAFIFWNVNYGFPWVPLQSLRCPPPFVQKHAQCSWGCYFQLTDKSTCKGSKTVNTLRVS